MSIRNYTNAPNTKRTPQSEPIPGREKDMSKNNAGGYSFKLDKWARLNRFLVLGSEGGSYYVSSKKLVKENAQSVLDCLSEDGVRVVDTVVAISDSGRAPKNTPAIYVLALAAKMGDEATARAAYQALPRVVRTGTHLFEWVEAIKALGSVSSGAQRAITRWYTDRPVHSLALQAVKYQSRGGWSHRDVLRLTKPSGFYPTGHEKATPEKAPYGDVFQWITKGKAPVSTDNGTALIDAFEQAKAIGSEGDVSKDRTRRIVSLIETHRLPRECIPTKYLNEVAVWEALLDNGGHGMPMTAMIRNLPKMTSIGLFKGKGGNKRLAAVTSRLKSEDALRHARTHPLQVLVAMRTYGSGHGIRGSLTWNPISQIVDALDGAFYKSFQAVQPTGKRWLLALDVSGSMGAGIAGMPGINCREAAAAMAMVTAATEEDTHIVGFTSSGPNPFTTGDRTWSGQTGIAGLDLSPRRRLDDNVRSISNLPFGGTDCALPMVYALKRKIETDVFVVYTDSETWFSGSRHPVQALREYRNKMGIDAKLIVVGMSSNGFSIADPKDSGMLDVVGFDTAAPNIMSEFVKGNI